MRRLTCSLLRLKRLTRDKVVILAALLAFPTAPGGVCTHGERKAERVREMVTLLTYVCVRLNARDLTRHSSSEAIWLAVQQSLPKLCLSTACWTDQRDRPLPIGWLVIQGHFLIGEDLLIVSILANGKTHWTPDAYIFFSPHIIYKQMNRYLHICVHIYRSPRVKHLHID